MERGIEFMVFPDGSFDFNTEINTYGDVYYRNSMVVNRTRRSSVNRTYGSPALNHLGGVIVTHASQGSERRIGNVFINFIVFFKFTHNHIHLLQSNVHVGRKRRRTEPIP